MFGFITHGLLFAFIASWFWIPGLVGWTARSFCLVTAIGFLVGGITYFFREKQIISPRSVDGESVSIAWRLLPTLITIGFLIFILWG
jgi:hypothetical protein